MAEDTKEVEKGQQPEVDERGVPLSNRIKELERKMADKYEKELAETRRELEAMKGSQKDATRPDPDEAAKAELMELVRNPREYVRTVRREEDFQREIPAAESWLRQQSGYTAEDDARIFQIIKDNKLDTPYHSPMERAKTAWSLLDAERLRKKVAERTDDVSRENRAQKSATEGAGKATSKQAQVTRADVIRKLAEAEAKGDLDSAIKYTSMLEDIRQ